MNKHDASYWTERYVAQNTGWDIGYPGPLTHILDEIEDKSKSILIPGAGNGYEADYALNKGFTDLHILDISPIPLENLKKRVPAISEDQLHCVDFFEHQHHYDYILEQTFFCALPPSLREQYVDQMHNLLSKGGILTGVMFDFPLDSGPPYGGSEKEYKSLFSSKFEIEIMERCQFSIPPRMGKELHVKFRKK